MFNRLPALQKKGMANPITHTRISQCSCGNVSFQVDGPPIMCVACYCDSCQLAGKQLEELSGATPILEADGSSNFLMCRKDRVSCLKGQDQLSAHWLLPSSTTRRVVAECCNTAMFLEFKGGHWLSMYLNRFDQADRPPIEMRTMTKYSRPGVFFHDDIPSPNKHTFSFMWKLMKAWASMGFKVPKLDFLKGQLDNKNS